MARGSANVSASVSASFRVNGKPVPKGRPRFVRGRAITPPETRVAERRIATIARSSGVRPRAGHVQVMIEFYVSTGVRGDIDNLAKLVLDALNGVAWVDDRQVVELDVAISRCPKGDDATLVWISWIGEPPP